MALESVIRTEAERALAELMDGQCGNPVQENARLKFIAASARYVRSVKELDFARNNPNLGFRSANPEPKWKKGA